MQPLFQSHLQADTADDISGDCRLAFPINFIILISILRSDPNISFLINIIIYQKHIILNRKMFDRPIGFHKPGVLGFWGFGVDDGSLADVSFLPGLSE